MSDDRPDYSFMRSGFNAVEAAVDEEEMKKNAISLIVAFSEGALRSAAKYVTHGGRNAVTPEDVKRGMMLEMFLFKRRDDTLEKAEEINYYYAYCHYSLGEYLMASYLFDIYAQTYLNGKHTEECQYMTAYCFYLLLSLITTTLYDCFCL